MLEINKFFIALFAVSLVFISCNNSHYDMIKGDSGVNELDSEHTEETKLNLSKDCKLCPSCNSDYRYFYVCSHGVVLMLCNECEAEYDVAYEGGKEHKEHSMTEECFNEASKVATRADLENAGLSDYINKLGLLEEDLVGVSASCLGKGTVWS